MVPPRNGEPTPWDDPGLRYVHTAIDPLIGECHFWSNLPGGLDAWDAANDPAVIAAVTGLPQCPVLPPVDVEIRAWEVFRSWDLDPPAPAITPPDAGITGLPTQVAADPPAAIGHVEILPDGRTLQVRAQVTLLTIGWGDGAITQHNPSTALGYPDGAAQHTYSIKTCSAQYRSTHPSGNLCHPTLDRYTLTTTYRWTGEYSLGTSWTELGWLDRTTTETYDVDEARGVGIP